MTAPALVLFTGSRAIVSPTVDGPLVLTWKHAAKILPVDFVLFRIPPRVPDGTDRGFTRRDQFAGVAAAKKMLVVELPPVLFAEKIVAKFALSRPAGIFVRPKIPACPAVTLFVQSGYFIQIYAGVVIPAIPYTRGIRVASKPA